MQVFIVLSAKFVPVGDSCSFCPFLL